MTTGFNTKVGIAGMRTSLWVSALLALVGAAPALAQAPVAGSWLQEVRRVRGAPIVAPVRRDAKTPLLASRCSPPARDETAATIAESEPNDGVSTADSVALGDRATGVVNPAGDVDTWFVDLTAGQFLSVDVDARTSGRPSTRRSSSSLHTAGHRSHSTMISTGSTAASPTASPRAAATTWRFARSEPRESPELTYAINFGTVTCTAVGTEQEPNGAPGTATPIAIGASGSGEICPHDDNAAGDVDYWAFTAQAGTGIEVDIDVVALGVFADPFVGLYASDGITQLAVNHDVNGISPLSFLRTIHVPSTRD